MRQRDVPFVQMMVKDALQTCDLEITCHGKPALDNSLGRCIQKLTYLQTLLRDGHLALLSDETWESMLHQMAWGKLSDRLYTGEVFPQARVSSSTSKWADHLLPVFANRDSGILSPPIKRHKGSRPRPPSKLQDWECGGRLVSGERCGRKLDSSRATEDPRHFTRQTRIVDVKETRVRLCNSCSQKRDPELYDSVEEILSRQ